MKLRLLTAIAFSALLAGSAFAADVAKPDATTPDTTAPSTAPSTDTVKLSTATGIVKSFDSMSHTLTLADNQSFVLEKGMKGKDLKADQHISLTFKQDGERKIVTQYKIEKQETAPTQG